VAKENNSAACLMASPTGYRFNIGGKPTYLIVIRHKPQSLAKINHEIRHVIGKGAWFDAGHYNERQTEKSNSLLICSQSSIDIV